MKITIIAVGKLKEKYWKDAILQYSKRLEPYCNFNIIETPDYPLDKNIDSEINKTLNAESKHILKVIPNGAHIILLAINAKELSSEQFAGRIEELGVNGKSHLCFIIGSSLGVSKNIYKLADESISFGKITLPHNLARVVLTEQIYRSFKIIRKEPYHK